MSEFKTWRSLPIWKTVHKGLKEINPKFNNASCFFTGPNRIWNIPSISILVDDRNICEKIKHYMEQFRTDFVLLLEDTEVVKPTISLDYGYIGYEKPTGCARKKVQK